MKTGYHAVYSADYFDGINSAREHGFDFVQFDLGVPRFFLDSIPDAGLREIKSYAEDKGVEITFHSPGDNVSLFCDYPLIRQGILDEFALILEKANILGARHVTLHAGIYPQFKKSGEKNDNSRSEYYAEVLRDNLKYLTDRSGDVIVCLENFRFDGASRRASRGLIKDGERLFLTLDTQKLYSSAGVIIKEDFEFFLELKDYIREIHLHDIHPEFGAHQIVGTGIVDFGLIRQFCNESTYLNFEVRPVGAARVSRENLNRIWGEGHS